MTTNRLLSRSAQAYKLLLQQIVPFGRGTRAELITLRNKLSHHEGELSARISERDDWAAKVNLLEARIADLTHDHAETVRLNSVLEQQRDALAAERDALTAERDASAAHAQNLSEALSVKEREQEVKAIELVAIKAHIQRLDDIIKEKDRERQAVEAHAQRLDEMLSAKDREFQASISVTQTLVGERDSAVGKCEVLTSTNDRLQSLLLGKFSSVEYSIAALKKNLDRSSLSSAVRVNGQAVLYLDLLENALTGYLFDDTAISPWSQGQFDHDARLIGRDWPSRAQTMIGKVRMQNLRFLTEAVLTDGIPGDFIETGVWRGGACIYMRGILAAHGIADRTVWVADSFAGLPPPDETTYPLDKGDEHHTMADLAITLDDVKDNFRKFSLLDDSVKFLKGWFKDTLPNAPIDRLALIRLDGDMYESTIQALDALYHKLSPGGALIVDDFLLPPCKAAVMDYRNKHNITEEIFEVDGAAVYWRKRSTT